MFRAAEPLLAREADGRAFRLIGIGAHDLVEIRRAGQGDLFGGGRAGSDVDKALDAVRDRPAPPPAYEQAIAPEPGEGRSRHG